MCGLQRVYLEIIRKLDAAGKYVWPVGCEFGGRSASPSRDSRGGCRYMGCGTA